MMKRLAILRDGEHVAGVLTLTDEGTIEQDPAGFMGRILGQIKHPDRGLNAIPLAKRLEIFERDNLQGMLTLTDAGVIEQEPPGFLTDILDWIKEHEHLDDVRLWATLELRMDGPGLNAIPRRY